MTKATTSGRVAYISNLNLLEHFFCTVLSWVLGTLTQTYVISVNTFE